MDFEEEIDRLGQYFTTNGWLLHLTETESKSFLANKFIEKLEVVRELREIRYLPLPLLERYSLEIRDKLQPILLKHYLDLRFRFNFTIPVLGVPFLARGKLPNHLCSEIICLFHCLD